MNGARQACLSVSRGDSEPDAMLIVQTLGYRPGHRHCTSGQLRWQHRRPRRLMHLSFARATARYSPAEASGGHCSYTWQVAAQVAFAGHVTQVAWPHCVLTQVAWLHCVKTQVCCTHCVLTQVPCPAQVAFAGQVPHCVWQVPQAVGGRYRRLYEDRCHIACGRCRCSHL